MKKKIVQFVHGFNMGGAETLIKDYCLKIDKDKFDVKVLCFYEYDSPYEKILEEAGIDITYIDHIANYPQGGKFAYLKRILLMIKRFVFVKKYIKNEIPDVIHTHLNNNMYVWYAKPKKGTKIFHTIHNELNVLWDDSLESKVDFYASKRLVKKYDLRFIALHDQMREDANKFFDVNNTVVLNNGIDFSRFDSAMPKNEIRKKESIPENAFVIGHIGRFNEQKNHTFLIDIFYEVSKKNPDAYLLMVGNGDLMEDVVEKIARLGIEDKTKILSYRTDIPDLMNAMDCFVFPSLYEGLSVVMIEAQKMKLPCFISDTISKSTEISNLIHWNSLESSPKTWAQRILNEKQEKVEYNCLDSWNMINVVKSLEKIYIEA